MGDKKKGRPRVVDGKIFAIATLKRRMDRLGYNQWSYKHLARVFTGWGKDGTGQPSLPLLRAISHALGLTLDETDELIQRCRDDIRIFRLYG